MTTRRNFLKQMSLATAGLAVGGAPVFGSSAQPTWAGSTTKTAGNDKVKIAFIGIGNRGEQNITEFEKTGMIEVVALCDVDMGNKQTLPVKNRYPKAKCYKDFRKMFDECGNEFDAVAISTPDHSHFPITMLALNQGKHVYVEKPLCRTFYEGELLIEAAKRNPQLATQVGNQGHSEANYFQFKAWQEAGIIKDVTAVTAHMNNVRRWHQFDSNLIKFPSDNNMPKTMDWDTWLMAQNWHEYSDRFHQGDWRCWYDFGMGVLGDWGAHLLDTVHEFLDLGYPYEINMLKAEGHNDFFFPYSTTLLFRFPARGAMPPVDITWYDGIDNQPPLPEGYGLSTVTEGVPATNQGETPKSTLNPGKIIYSRDLTFKGGSHGSTLEIIPKEKALDMANRLPEIPQSPSNHYVNFLNACMGKEKTRSPFEICGVLCQVFCLGVIAQRLNTQLFFDARTKTFTNNQFANALLYGNPPRKGWEQFYKM